MTNSSFAKKLHHYAAIAAGAIAVSTIALPAPAATLTRTSPVKGGTLVSSGVSDIGGIVLDILGTNDARVTSQLSAGSLFQGWTSPFTRNTTIGTQSGFTSSVLSVLGGGIKEVGIRFTLYDGDTASRIDASAFLTRPYLGNFDYNENFLLVNGLNFGNWSDVKTINTDSSGNAGSWGFSGGGFRNELLDTGWFHVTDAVVLSSFYQKLSSGSVVYQLYDNDPGDQYLNFKQGIASNMVEVSLAPVVQPPAEPPSSESVPEPASTLGFIASGAMVARYRLKGKSQ